MVIPHRSLSPEALRGLIEDFVTRDGTDYGEREIPLATKVSQVQALLDQGAVVIVYSDLDGSCNIVPKAEVPIED